MLQRHRDIYASAPLRRLLDDETRALTTDLQRCFGSHALLLSAADDAPPVLPMLGCWIRLEVDKDGYRGDLRAATDEPLPFVDDAFDLVLLRHALEVVPLRAAVLAEAIRVLAPGGVLALTGLHPLGGWAPWFHWQARGERHALQMPMGLRHSLQQAGLQVERTQRVGRLWPSSVSSAPHAAGAGIIGGGYVLIARKRQRLSTPLHLKKAAVQVPANVRLSPSTRRSAAP